MSRIGRMRECPLRALVLAVSGARLNCSRSSRTLEFKAAGLLAAAHTLLRRHSRILPTQFRHSLFVRLRPT